MAIDYNSKISTLVGLLQAHNTTTASPDLSGSLTTRIQTITTAEPDVSGQRHGFYPYVSVELSNANEEETQIGAFSNRRKIKNITFNIWGFYKQEGISKNQTQLLSNFYQMASNIEAVLKAESTMSGTALFVQPISTSFSERRDNNLIKVLKIETSISYFYT